VVANNSLFWGGRDVLIIDKGGHKNSVIKDNPGSLVEVKAKPATRK